MNEAINSLPALKLKSMCQLCEGRLDPDSDNMELRLCMVCQKHPDGIKILMAHRSPKVVSSIRPSKPTSAREFTPADKSLIRKLHGYMPADQLLGILNDRLVSDRGITEVRYTMEQLHAEIGEVSGPAPTGGYDWSSLRKLLAMAKKRGVLELITEQLIDDFCVVYSLSMAQGLRLKDVLLRNKEDE
jgi:hypothetical protein